MGVVLSSSLFAVLGERAFPIHDIFFFGDRFCRPCAPELNIHQAASAATLLPRPQRPPFRFSIDHCGHLRADVACHASAAVLVSSQLIAVDRSTAFDQIVRLNPGLAPAVERCRLARRLPMLVTFCTTRTWPGSPSTGIACCSAVVHVILRQPGSGRWRTLASEGRGWVRAPGRLL